jgi:hypothetical protein
MHANIWLLDGDIRVGVQRQYSMELDQKKLELPKQ